MSKKGPHKSVLSKSKASSSVGVITFQNGLKQQSTTDFPKIAQDLIDAASTIAAIPNQTAHAAIFDKFSTYLSGQRFATHILEACSDILRTETTALKIKMALSKDDYDSKRLLTLSLEKRINAIYFLLECVIPKHEQMQELKLALLNLLWEDVVQIFENLNAIISLNLAPPGHNLSYIELANNSFTIFEKYSPFYTDILDNLINNKKTNLPLRTTSEMSRHVYQSYANFIIIEASTAFVRNILGETDAAMAALAQATQRLKVMRENLPKIIACAHLNKKSTEEAIERSLQKRISWLTDHFSQPPLMTNILLKSVLSTLDHSSNEFLSLLKMLHNSNDVASLLEDDLLVNEISAPIAELTKQIMTLTTAKLPISEGLNLETKMHFLNIWVNILQIERCNKSQAFTLLPMINKLLLAGRDFFLQDQRTILAKVIAEKFEEITKKSIQTRLQLSMATKPEASSSVDQEAKLKAEQEAKLKAEQEAKLKAKHAARSQRRAAAKANRKAEEEEAARRKAEEEEAARRKTEEEETAKCKAEEEAKLILSMKALTLSSYEFIPVCLPFKPSEFTISLPKSVQAILEKLNRQGYWAVVVGGAVRDHLLNAEPNDFDIISNCPKDKLTQILKISSNESIFVPGLFEFDTEDGHEIDLVCTQRSLIDELKTRDLSINTLIADRYGIVYDLLGKKEDLRNNYLVMMGDINDRLEEDPSRICRLVRICAHLGKGISAEYAQAMLQKAPLITRKLGFGAYVKSLETLFLRGEAKTNLKILLKLGLMPFLTPGAQSIKNDLTIFIKFLNRKSYHLDMTDKGTRKSHFKGYHIIALLLIPELLDQINDQRLLGDAIDNVLNAFCLTYEGAFSDQEKTQFNSIKQIMIDYYLEYVNYQARHKAHLRASQAKQKNIPTASSSQSVPLIKRKQNKPTLIQFQDYVKAAEYTSEQTNNKKNSSSRNRDKNLKRI